MAKPTDELFLFRDGDTERILAFKFGAFAKSTMDGVNWRKSTLAQGAMFDPGTDAVPVTEAQAREIHPNLVLPD